MRARTRIRLRDQRIKRAAGSARCGSPAPAWRPSTSAPSVSAYIVESTPESTSTIWPQPLMCTLARPCASHRTPKRNAVFSTRPMKGTMRKQRCPKSGTRKHATRSRRRRPNSRKKRLAGGREEKEKNDKASRWAGAYRQRDARQRPMCFNVKQHDGGRLVRSDRDVHGDYWTCVRIGLLRAAVAVDKARPRSGWRRWHDARFHRGRREACRRRAHRVGFHCVAASASHALSNTNRAPFF